MTSATGTEIQQTPELSNAVVPHKSTDGVTPMGAGLNSAVGAITMQALQNSYPRIPFITEELAGMLLFPYTRSVDYENLQLKY
jgi:hypothetical protein